MKPPRQEFSNTFCDDPPGGESRQSPSVINEIYKSRLESLIDRAKSFPVIKTEGTSVSSSETEHLEIGEHDGQYIALYFFIYTPEENPENHLPYSPSINAKCVLEPADSQPEAIYDTAYLSLKHLDASNSRYDEAKLQERFDKLEMAMSVYEAALSISSQPSSQ